MTLKRDAKFKEKLTFGFNYDMRNLINCHLTTQESENFLSMIIQKSEILYFDWLFSSKAYNVSTRKFQRNYVS